MFPGLEKINIAPIIIVSSPRTGSSALAYYLAEQKQYKLFNEPTKTALELHKFFIYEAQNKHYVLKEHALRLAQKYSNICEQPCYKIRIRRRNIFAQVLSHYVASQRKQFLFSKTDKFEPDLITFDPDKLLAHWNNTQMNNREADQFRYPIDLDLYYEDLEFPEHNLIPSVVPLNNEELTEWAQTVLKDKL